MSTKRTIDSSPSKTAVFAAMYRAIAHNEAPDGRTEHVDYLAELFLPVALRLLLKFGFVRRTVRAQSDKLTPGLYEYVVARTAFMDAQYLAALNDGVEQIVLLGAGYDSRAYRLLKVTSKVRVIELDVEETLKRKKACLVKVRREVPGGVVFASINFDKQALTDVLTQNGYDNSRKTLFLWEGVSYYLGPAAVDRVLDLVRCNRHPESRIVFDYAIPLDEGNMDRIFGARAFVETWKKRRSGEPFVFTVGEGDLRALLAKRGLELLKHSDAEEIDRYYLGHEGQDHAGRVSGYFRFAVAARRQDIGRQLGEVD